MSPWTRWFAWWPVRVGGKLRWLRYVERHTRYLTGWGDLAVVETYYRDLR